MERPFLLKQKINKPMLKEELEKILIGKQTVVPLNYRSKEVEQIITLFKQYIKAKMPKKHWKVKREDYNEDIQAYWETQRQEQGRNQAIQETTEALLEDLGDLTKEKTWQE